MERQARKTEEVMSIVGTKGEEGGVAGVEEVLERFTMIVLGPIIACEIQN